MRAARIVALVLALLSISLNVRESCSYDQSIVSALLRNETVTFLEGIHPVLVC